jgi:hypothetical protein
MTFSTCGLLGASISFSKTCFAAVILMQLSGTIAPIFDWYQIFRRSLCVTETLRGFSRDFWNGEFDESKNSPGNCIGLRASDLVGQQLGTWC